MRPDLEGDIRQRASFLTMKSGAAFEANSSDSCSSF